MKRKIIIILAILAVCILLASPVVAKQKVKVKISTDDCVIKNKGYIVIKLVDKNGREIRSNGMIKYTITDDNGNYKWVSKSYGSGIRVKYDVGHYNVNVVFKGDSKYKGAEKTKDITVTNDFDAYTYYDNHNWGLNQEVDDYIGDNYWNEEIYDDVDDPENEAWNI
ncbi:MAG: hypothetical protein E7Z79_01985 [Methanobrevibacter thaueri]|uniref:Uncharacterized protein n=1 Tax=Methanobrevibacter thaueri TaxID=190975 RepID=A0A8T3VCX8_9EURY|nr:hypothetical protein [Methanobrevibacter thaueri]MBE6501195.1 hypothetical protein [Methanobrevibacter thaueri]